MRSLSFSHSEALDVFLGQLEAFVDASQALCDMDLLKPSMCSGWSRLDAVVHVRAGLEEMMAGYLTHTTSDPDHDAASHWGSHPDDRDVDPVPHILWLRRTASAYGRPSAAVRHLKAVHDRVRKVVAGSSDRTIEFQNMTLSGGDFLATWTVELAVHHLDLNLSQYTRRQNRSTSRSELSKPSPCTRFRTVCPETKAS